MIIEIYNRKTGERCNMYSGSYRVEYTSANRGLFNVQETSGSHEQRVATYSLNMFGFSEHVED